MRRMTRLWALLCLFSATLWLRVANLDYSDYQGDEIAALAQPSSAQSWLDFILAQRKGPIQFLITQLIRLVDPSVTNEFITRLAFALAGVSSVLVFFALVKLHTNERAALFSALFMAVNGIFVGLTRIVQYQAFVLLLSISALYAFSLAIFNPRWKISGIYAGFALWTLALLTHYDGIFIAPFAVCLIYRWYRDKSDHTEADRLLCIGLPAGAGLAILASFYALLFWSSSAVTQSYWLGRILGESQESGVLVSSIATFELYNPLFALPIYIGLGLLSLVEIKHYLPVWGWFLFAWTVMEVLIHEPGTHIYTYLLPASILVGIGLNKMTDRLRRITPGLIGQVTSLTLPVLILGGLFSLSHLIFIDHTPEYPWQARGFLFWKLERPSAEYKLWVFGFPYRRHWEEIGAYVASLLGESTYLSNEKDSISEYYLPNDLVRSPEPEIYIHIDHPQSFVERLANEKIRYWIKNYPPVQTYQNGEQVVTEIYLLPPGSLGAIQAAGY